jgi:hypothetical protein
MSSDTLEPSPTPGTALADASLVLASQIMVLGPLLQTAATYAQDDLLLIVDVRDVRYRPRQPTPVILGTWSFLWPSIKVLAPDVADLLDEPLRRALDVKPQGMHYALVAVDSGIVLLKLNGSPALPFTWAVTQVDRSAHTALQEEGTGSSPTGESSDPSG